MRAQVPYASGQRPVTVNSAQLSPRTLLPEGAFPVIRGLDSESIDPIATDSPFDKGERTRGNQLIGWASTPGTRMFGGMGRACEGI